VSPTRPRWAADAGCSSGTGRSQHRRLMAHAGEVWCALAPRWLGGRELFHVELACLNTASPRRRRMRSGTPARSQSARPAGPSCFTWNVPRGAPHGAHGCVGDTASARCARCAHAASCGTAQSLTRLIAHAAECGDARAAQRVARAALWNGALAQPSLTGACGWGRGWLCRLYGARRARAVSRGTGLARASLARPLLRRAHGWGDDAVCRPCAPRAHSVRRGIDPLNHGAGLEPTAKRSAAANVSGTDGRVPDGHDRRAAVAR